MNTLLPIVLALTLGRLAADDLRQATVLRLGDRAVTVARLEQLPLVENDYSRRFKFDSARNPKLAELRDRYRLDQVVASGPDEFARQVLLMDWVHRRFQKFGRPTSASRGALEILDGIARGETYFCAQYAQLLCSAAASLGWVDRVLALRRHQDAPGDGSSEHSTTEIWSNQHRKWVMLDPTSNLYLEKNGVPLNAFEIRQEWFYRGGQDLVFVIGRERRRYRKADLPIFLRHFADFGDLKIDPRELDKYGFIGYLPNTDLMDSGYDYGRMFIVQDQLCTGTAWHTRDHPAHPESEPYFPLGQTVFSARTEGGRLTIRMRTFTPNFKEFQIRTDGGPWRRTEAEFPWEPEPGPNRLEGRALNAFDVAGPVSFIELAVE